MSANTSRQNEPESPTSSSLPEPPKPDVKTESSTTTTEEKPDVLPGMILRDTKLPGRKLGDRDVRIVHNKTLSAEERNAIGQRTKKIFAERKAKRKQIAERLHNNKRLKAEEREVKPEEPTEPPMPIEAQADGIGKRIAMLERTRRFQRGSLDFLMEKEVKIRKKRRVSAKNAGSDDVEVAEVVEEIVESVASGSGGVEDGDVAEDSQKEGQIEDVCVESPIKVGVSEAKINEDVNIDEPSTSQEEAIKPDIPQQPQYVHREPVQIIEEAEVYEEVIYVDEPDQYDEGQPIYYINQADQDQIIEIVETYEE